MSCPLADIWTNTQTFVTDDPDGPDPVVTVVNKLIRYSPTGSVVSEVATPHTYGDIAWSSDGSTLYGIEWDGGDPDVDPTLYTIDPVSGAETAALPITGPLEGFSAGTARGLNGLSALSDGRLLVGSFVSQTIFALDPADGSSTEFGAAFPGSATVPGSPDYVSSGDFMTLSDGDILAVAISVEYDSDGHATNYVSTLFRIHPDMTMTPVGTLPPTYGAAQSGGSIYFATADGRLLRLDDVPTAESTDSIVDVVEVADTGEGYYGATSIQDAGECTVQVPTSYTVAKAAATKDTPARVGDTVTYTVTVTNTGDNAYPATGAGFTDDLSNVLASADLVTDSVQASAGTATVTGNTLSWVGPLAVAPDPGATVTVTYQVTITQAGATLINGVVPTGTLGSCASDADCATTVTVDKPTQTVTPTVPPTTPPADDPEELAETGLDAQTALVVGFVLITLGGAALAVRRKRAATPLH